MKQRFLRLSPARRCLPPLTLRIFEDIVAITFGNPDFSTLLAALVAALQTADLVIALQAEGSFTVFAPTNAAFAALPAGTVESLLLPENQAELVRILT
ncbi:MAG: fasciclin domain-containing protein [Cyanobacteriota bacterium]